MKPKLLIIDVTGCTWHIDITQDIMVKLNPDIKLYEIQFYPVTEIHNTNIKITTHIDELEYVRIKRIKLTCDALQNSFKEK